MVGTFFKRLLTALILLALQVLVFNHVQFLGYATPMVCIYILLLFPLGTPRYEILLWGFGVGLIQDIFSNTPGMNAGSLTLVGLMQPFILKIFLSRDADEEEALPPSATYMGWGPFLRYVILAVLIQQLSFYLLEAFSFFNLKELGINVGGGTLISFLIILAIESVRKGGSKGTAS